MPAEGHSRPVLEAGREIGLAARAHRLAEVHVQGRLVAPLVIPGGDVNLVVVAHPDLDRVAGPAAVLFAWLVGIDLVGHRGAIEPAKRQIESVGVVHRCRPHRGHVGILPDIGAAVDHAA